MRVRLVVLWVLFFIPDVSTSLPSNMWRCSGRYTYWVINQLNRGYIENMEARFWLICGRYGHWMVWYLDYASPNNDASTTWHSKRWAPCWLRARKANIILAVVWTPYTMKVSLHYCGNGNMTQTTCIKSQDSGCRVLHKRIWGDGVNRPFQCSRTSTSLQSHCVHAASRKPSKSAISVVRVETINACLAFNIPIKIENTYQWVYENAC